MHIKRRISLFLTRLFGGSESNALPPPRSALFHTAQTILSIPQGENSWDPYIQQSQHYAEFLWTGDGDAIDCWNALYAGKNGVGKVDFTVEGEQQDFILAYQGKKLQAPVVNDREDDIIVIVTLNRLLKGVSDIRYCVDSYHSSEIAFLALPPTDWSALDAEFSSQAVAYRFMPLPDDMATFWAQHQAMEDDVERRRYF